MSEWYEVVDEDIEIDEMEKEVNFLVTNNKFGNVYATITFKQLNELNEKMKSKRLNNVK